MFVFLCVLGIFKSMKTGMGELFKFCQTSWLLVVYEMGIFQLSFFFSLTEIEKKPTTSEVNTGVLYVDIRASLRQFQVVKASESPDPHFIYYCYSTFP